MFDPIKASKEIKDSYIDYITTTFDMADTDYEREFRKELQTDGMVASGPFLDIGGSYETGHTLRELIQAQKASVLFERLEPVAEKERELKLDRPLSASGNSHAESGQRGKFGRYDRNRFW